MMPEKKWAFVVGASRGLGLLLVKGLRGHGWRVTASVRGAKVASELTDDPQVDLVRVDVTSTAQI